jgi:hypothetical protein
MLCASLLQKPKLEQERGHGWIWLCECLKNVRECPPMTWLFCASCIKHSKNSAMLLLFSFFIKS